MRTHLVALILTGVLLAGCASEGAGIDRQGTGQDPDMGGGPVVIALIDSGASPYYPIYATDDAQRVKDAVRTDFTEITIDLPSGTGDPVDRDRAIWESLEPGVLYHFAGTRLFGISVDEDREYHYVRDTNQHGAATSYLAAREAPDAVIVMVQIGLGLCEQADCVFSPTIAAGMKWAAEQEWIDVISVSLAMPGNLPDRPELHKDMEAYLAASLEAARNGKIIVNGAGNHAVPPIAGYFNGPPWVIAVGGVSFNESGDNVYSAKTVDVVANFTDLAPFLARGELEWGSGTSYATPIVAGTLANALARVRMAQPERDVRSEELRDALNASAVYFDATSWDPAPHGPQELPNEIMTSLSLPQLIQPQMGWGYVNSSLADEIARRIIEDDLAIGPHKAQAQAFQPAWQRSREAFWDVYG